MDFIMEGLCDSVKEKVGKCSSTKELWDKLHDIYFSPITKLEFAKEDTGTKHEERCSSCQIDSEEEECEVTEANIGEFFFFNCEERKHLEIECPYLKISDEIENSNKIEAIKSKLISALDELKKEREESMSLKKELMKQKESVQIF
jgi:hypothetical protein